MLKRTFDILSCLFVLLIIWPFFLVLLVLVLFSGKGGAFFVQKRVGKSGVDFKLFKFRTMRLDSESSGQITIGGRDPRITKIGYFLRKFKLDELPQLLNIIGGSMSVVGPRPEVRKYVQMYTEEQLKVLSIKPGLTDYASIEYIDENEILGRAEDPNEAYINEVMPAKLALNQKYIDEQSFGTDFKIIFRTIGKVFS
jgi:lipopolysaccharide/colanic/teichoic acid biosynthesis glycosyltransferase